MLSSVCDPLDVWLGLVAKPETPADEIRILHGDCRTMLRTLPEQSVNCIVTSPPYFGLRDYGVDGQIGLEQTPEAYVAELVDVFRECRRVLADDGTLWLNLGDSYAANRSYQVPQSKHQAHDYGKSNAIRVPVGLKPKDLIGIPWRVAFALQADGWYLRSSIIWHKPNPMPESVRDRPTNAHENIFLFAKQPKYFYDAEAVKEPFQTDPKERYLERARITGRGTQGAANARGRDRDKSGGFPPNGNGRNLRNIWTITTKPFKGAHFATFPPDLVEPCVKAGCPAGGTVLDPFGGSGTTALVARQLGRRAVLIELNSDYIEIARNRLGL